MKKLPKIKLSQKPTYIKLGENIDFYELFQKIEQEFENCFIFESLGEDGKFSRYSVMGFDPEHIISARKNNLTIDGIVYPVKNPYTALRKIMPDKTITRDYAGGLIGYLSYDCVNYFEDSVDVKIDDKFEQFMFGAYTDGVILDKETDELFYFYYKKNRIENIKMLMSKTSKKTLFKADFIKNSIDIEEYTQMVRRVKDEIKKGNTFQCVVGMKSEYKIKGDTLAIYEKLRVTNPSPFMYYVKFGKNKIIGSSPELLFSLKDGEITTRPLAGTIKRGKNDAEDTSLARELLNDPKELAEHSMLVDLHRNDIGRVAQFGTVRIRDLMSVKKFSHVQHISSEISGTIKLDEDMFSALSSNFPTGTLSGAPKLESIKIIDREENNARGPYGGGIGHFGFNGDSVFAIAIRTLFVSGEYAYTHNCSGIVCDSEVKKEYEEILKKAASMKEVLST